MSAGALPCLSESRLRRGLRRAQPACLLILYIQKPPPLQVMIQRRRFFIICKAHPRNAPRLGRHLPDVLCLYCTALYPSFPYTVCMLCGKFVQSRLCVSKSNRHGLLSLFTASKKWYPVNSGEYPQNLLQRRNHNVLRKR